MDVDKTSRGFRTGIALWEKIQGQTHKRGHLYGAAKGAWGGQLVRMAKGDTLIFVHETAVYRPPVFRDFWSTQ